MTLFQSLLTAGEIPGDGHVIASAGKEAAAIATPADGIDMVSRGEGLPERTGAGIPDFHAAVLAAGGQPFAIG